MTYQSPLHIFADRPIDQLDASALKKLRKEYLLKFDLSGETTIKIQEREYDKAGIIAIFDGLKQDGEMHLKVFNNKALLNFLEKGNLTFFKESEHWKVLDDTAFSNWINPYLSSTLGRVVYKLSTTTGFGSIRELEALKKSGFVFSEGTRYTIFSQTYQHFDNWLDECQELMFDPFVENSNQGRFKAEVLSIFHKGILNTIKALPEDIFQPIVAKYAGVATQALSKAFYKDREFKEFNKSTLYALEQAGRVYLHDDPNDRNIKKITDDIFAFINYGNVGGTGISAWGIIRICIIVLIALSRLATCSNSSSSSTNNYKYLNVENQERMQDLIRGAMIRGTWIADYKEEVGKDSLQVMFALDLQKGSRVEVRASILDKEGNKVCHYDRLASWREEKAITGEDVLNIRFLGGSFHHFCIDGITKKQQSVIQNIDDKMKGDFFSVKVINQSSAKFSHKKLELDDITFYRQQH